MSKQRARIRPFSFVLAEFVAIVIASKKNATDLLHTKVWRNFGFGFIFRSV